MQDLRRKSCVSMDRSLLGCVSNGKIERIIQIVEASLRSNTKTVIVSSSCAMLGIVRHFIQQKGIQLLQFDGTLSLKARETVMRTFQSKNTDFNILLLSLKAGALGLTLTAASNMILVDHSYNPFIEKQAIDRIYRFGQNKKVTVYRLVVEESIEERILEIQDRKLNMVHEIFDEQIMPASSEYSLLFDELLC